MTAKKSLVLVDGSALAFRSFYALFTAGMRTAEGIPTWAVFGFLKALFEILDKRKPDMIAVCFDLAAPTFRHIEFEDYKANRAEMPDDLSAQWPIIKESVEALSIPIYEMEGYEADDIIGTMARDAEAHDMEVLILTGDQDVFQLLDATIQVLMPARQGGGLTTFGRQDVRDKLGIWPEQVADYKALCGDSSDNIPGVKGIGAKTAAALLNQFPNIEEIYSHLDEIKSESIKQKLKDGKKTAFSCKDLATIRVDVPVKFDYEQCKVHMPELDKVVELCRTYEFNNFLKNLPKILASFNDGKTPQIAPEMLEPIIREKKRRLQPAQLSLFSGIGPAEDSPEGLVVSSDDQLDQVLQEISRSAAVTLELDLLSGEPQDGGIAGYAFCWSGAAKLSSDQCLTFNDQGLAIKKAYIPVGFPDNPLDAKQVESRLRGVFENEAIGKIAHNAKPIMNVLSLLNISLQPLVFDPMIASYVADPIEDHGLTEQAASILSIELQSPATAAGGGRKGKQQAKILDLTECAKLATERAAAVLQLARHYCINFDQEQKDLFFDMDLPLVSVLARMEQAGIALDLPYLEEFSEELAVQLSRLEKEIYRLADHEFNINSSQQLQKVLFEELKLSVRGRTKSGYSTDASVLESIVDEHPIVSKILEYRQSSKLKSTYVDALPRLVSALDSRLHGEFNQTVTSTGRLSSSNPNLQNIPIRTELGRRIRRAIITGKKSYQLLAADYSQIELRLLAHMSGDELLIAAFQQDEDIHARTAMEIFDVDAKKVTSDMRRIGKTLNFALIYQQGAYATAASLGVTAKEAQGFMDKYFSRYPRVKGFLAQIIEDARKNGYTTTLWGRRRYFRYLNDANDMIRKAEERAACNAPLQGSAADLIKLAMIRVDKELKQKGLNARMILQVHDELVFEVPKDEVEDTKKLVVDAMSLDQPLKVPLRIDTGVGKNWMEMK